MVVSRGSQPRRRTSQMSICPSNAPSKASRTQRKSLPTRLGFGSQGYLSRLLFQRRSTSGCTWMCSAAALVVTQRRTGGVGGRASGDITASQLCEKCCLATLSVCHHIETTPTLLASLPSSPVARSLRASLSIAPTSSRTGDSPRTCWGAACSPLSRAWRAERWSRFMA